MKPSTNIFGAIRPKAEICGRTFDNPRSSGENAIIPMIAEVDSRISATSLNALPGKGSSDCIATLVERKTGFVQIGKLTDRTTASLNQKTLMLIRRIPTAIKTITTDNGTEFHQYKKIEKKSGIKFYFASPYHSWERGSNENCNGLIRQYLPKGISMASLTQQQCDAIANKLNARPRKCHHYKAPEELFYAR